MTQEADIAVAVESIGSGVLWKLLLLGVIAVFTYLVYKRSHKASKNTTNEVIARNSTPRKRKCTDEMLASIYCSARSEASRMRRASALVKALGIADHTRDFQKIADNFQTVEEVSEAMKRAGLESTNLIFGIDFTKSNLYTGRYTFDGNSLHHLDEQVLNPYQKVITILGKTLAPFDKDGLIPTFGFGDSITEDKKVFPVHDGKYCDGFQEVLKLYNNVASTIELGGPTDFAPLIRKAIRIVEKSGEYHILVIIGDGQVTAQRRTQDAIVEASHYPLSIIMVGVGDGPWEIMEEFDDKLPKRKFDNFQFLHFDSVIINAEFPEATFALNALMEVPGQFQEIKKQGILKQKAEE